MHENCTPSHHLTLRQITASQVLRATAAGRTPFAATEMAKSVVVGLDRKQGSGWHWESQVFMEDKNSCD